jgi:hypothetical protein
MGMTVEQWFESTLSNLCFQDAVASVMTGLVQGDVTIVSVKESTTTPETSKISKADISISATAGKESTSSTSSGSFKTRADFSAIGSKHSSKNVRRKSLRSRSLSAPVDAYFGSVTVKYVIVYNSNVMGQDDVYAAYDELKADITDAANSGLFITNLVRLASGSKDHALSTMRFSFTPTHTDSH